MDHSEINRLKTELAEAVGLLWFIQGYLEEGQDSHVKSKIRRFISRHRLDEHAQAEQQEAPASLTCEAQRAICGNCGGSGDVHRTDGEWMGTCTCPAGQEAQGTQAEDERAVFERWAKERSWFDPQPSTKERDDSLFFYEDAITDHNWIAWQARAALATQPAVPEPVAYCDDFTLGMLKSGQVYSVGVTPAAQRHEGESHALYVVPAAVRGAEHE